MATSLPDRQPVAVSPALVEELRRCCRQIKDSAEACEREAEQGLEEACRRHLETAHALRGRIAHAADALRSARREAPGLAVAQVRATAAECGRMIEESGRACARLVTRAAALRDQVGRELAKVQQARKVLRTYGGATAGARRSRHLRQAPAPEALGPQREESPT
jgi:hypothetical protein